MATQTSPNINAERIKGHLQLSASTTASSQLNLIQGTAPVSPVAGDIYRTSSHIVIYNHLAIENSGTGALRIGNVGNTNARDLSIYRNAQLTQAASSAMLGKIFLSDVNGANYRLIGEVTIAATTRSATTIGATSTFTFSPALLMRSGQLLGVTISVRAGAQDDTSVIAYGGNY